MASDTREHESRSTRAVPGVPGPPIRLTWVLTGLVGCAALAGLLVQDVYAGDAPTAEMLRAFDLVALLLVAPGLVVSVLRVRLGSMWAHLVLAALLAYLVYSSAYYLFGTGFNALFLLHAAVFSLGLVVLGLTLASLDVSPLAAALRGRAPARAVSAMLFTLALALGGMWIYSALDNAVTGDVPAGSQLVETEAVVHLGMALDLALLVPLYAAAAVLLWRRAPWGYALAGVALLSGVLHQVSYVVAMPFQVAGDVPGAVSNDPAEPVIVIFYLAASVLLFWGVPRRRAHPATRAWTGRAR